MGSFDVLISVIVTTYNRPKALDLVLMGLSKQTDHNYEVVVADDGSGFETRKIIEKWKSRSPLRLIHAWQNDDGFRLNQSRNNGIKKSSGEYIVVLDGDCIPRRNFVAQHRKLMERGWAVAGNRCLLSPDLTNKVEEGEEDLLGWHMIDYLKARLTGEINRLSTLFVFPPDWSFRYKNPYNWKIFRGCNMAFFREDAYRVNGFDESFHGWGLDDSDFAVRMINSGVRIKSGRFSTGVFHLYHREGSLVKDSFNSSRFSKVIKDRLVNPLKGLAGKD